MIKMKSVGLSDEVYELLLHTKHEFEQKAGEVLSYDKIVRKLILNNGCNKTTDPIQEVNGEEPNQTEGGGEFSSRNKGGGDELQN